MAGGNCVEVGERGERVREGAVDGVARVQLGLAAAVHRPCLQPVSRRVPLETLFSRSSEPVLCLVIMTKTPMLLGTHLELP